MKVSGDHKVERNFSTESSQIKFYSLADRWKSERKLLNSSFSLAVLQSYTPIFNQCVLQSLDYFRRKCDSGEFDIKNDLHLVVMTVALSEWSEKAQKYFLIPSIVIQFHSNDIWQGGFPRIGIWNYESHREVSRS